MTQEHSDLNQIGFEKPYLFDDGSDAEKLNIKNEEKPAVHPQQKALAHNILKRMKYTLQLQQREFQFTDVDMQVRNHKSH